VPADGLVAASGGKHGIAIAHTARVLGVKAEIFVPGVSSRAKIDRLRAQGALVNIVGELYDDAQEACDARAASIDALKIHPYNAPLMVAGQATLGVDLVEQVPGIDTVFVAIGGEGLGAGLRLALHFSVRVIALETEACNAFHPSRAAREPVDVSPAGVGNDALGPRRIGELPWSILAATTESIVVDDASVIRRSPGPVVAVPTRSGARSGGDTRCVVDRRLPRRAG
jgi:threonine dehydratase